MLIEPSPAGSRAGIAARAGCCDNGHLRRNTARSMRAPAPAIRAVLIIALGRNAGRRATYCSHRTAPAAGRCHCKDTLVSRSILPYRAGGPFQGIYADATCSAGRGVGHSGCRRSATMKGGFHHVHRRIRSCKSGQKDGSVDGHCFCPHSLAGRIFHDAHLYQAISFSRP